MKEQALVHKPLPQNPDIWVSVPDYKEPILPVSNGFGWYGLQAYDFQGDKLMCHECGRYFNELSHHLKTHKLSSDEYKSKYGLMRSSNLTSKSYFLNRRENALKNNLGEIGRSNLKPKKKGDVVIRGSLEAKNTKDTCPLQLLRWITDASKVYGNSITISQLNTFRPGLLPLIIKEYGSFNKAKQILQLTQNENSYPHPEIFTRRMVLEDIILFMRKTHRKPSTPDYRKGKMICSVATIRKHDGLKRLIPEAQQLKDEQDKRSSIDINGIANNIEMEYAGRARI